MRADSKTWARSGAIFLFVLLVGYLSSSVQERFLVAFCAAVNPVLGLMTYDGRANVRLSPAPPTLERRADEQVTTDTVLQIRVRGAGILPVGMSQRRDTYLPLVVFLALTLAAPLPPKRLLINLGVGLLVIYGVAVASVAALVEILALSVPGLSSPSESWRAVLQFVFERWLTPPGNRVIAPLLLSALLLAPFIRFEDGSRTHSTLFRSP